MYSHMIILVEQNK